MYVVPRQVRAARVIVLLGVSYAKDQVLTAAQILGLPRLDSLLSAGLLVADPDVYLRRGTTYHKPTHLAPVALDVLTSVPDFAISATADEVNALRITAVAAGGDAPFSFDWGDTALSEVKGRTSTHTYAADGSYDITCTGENGDTATATVVIPAFGVTVDLDTDGYTATAVIAGGIGPFDVDWGDGTTAVADAGRAPTHTYTTVDTFTVTVTASDASTATADVTTTGVSIG